MKKINDFLVNNKKLMLIAPVVLTIILVFSYFILPKNEVAANPNNKNFDMSLPESNTKEVPDNKLDAYTQYEQYEEQTAETAEKDKSLNAINDFNDPSIGTDKNQSTKQATVYQNPNNDVSEKISTMLKKLEQKKREQQAVRTNNTTYTPNVYATKNTTVTDNKEDELASFKKKSQEAFSSFFNQSSSTGVNPQSSNKQSTTDPLIYCAIKGDQKIVNGDRVNLILTKEATINSKKYSANTEFYAIANFAKNRVNLKITNISSNPINLVATDAQDGNPGIYIAGESLLKEASTEATNDQVQDINVNGIPLGKTVKKIFQRKARENNVLLLNNYKLILKSER